MSSFPLAISLSAFPPPLVFLLGAALLLLVPRKLRALVMIGTPVLSFVALISAGEGMHGTYELLGEQLTMFRVDSTSLVFGYVFHLAALLGVIYALTDDDALQDVSALAYAGSAVGATFAGDLITFLLWWEVMAVTSVFLILARRTPESNNAAFRYFLWQLASGVLVLFGIVFHYTNTGSFAFGSMTDGLMAGEPGPLLIFLGFGIKCGWPLVHSWITDGYPAATPAGAVFLSAFTTKVAVYALLRGFPGAEPLVVIGTGMALFPIFYAVIENDLRRVLCYSMINQVGYMVVGIGIGTHLSMNGTAAHAFADILFKGLLFMSMGAVLFRTGKIKGSELGGLYHTMPKTAALCAVGAASISAFPLFSGFVTKSMIMTAAAEEGRTVVWFCLLFGAAGVFHHAGIKIPFFAFFAHDSGMRPKEAPKNMLFAMAVSAACCIAIGSLPFQTLYRWLPFPVDYEPYTTMHVITQTQLLFFSALAFCTLMITRLYPPELPSVNLDADWFTRMGARKFVAFDTGPLMRVFGRVSRFVNETVPAGLGYFAKNPAGAMNLLWDRLVMAGAALFGGPEALARAQARLVRDQARYAHTRGGAAWPIGMTVLYMSLVFLAVLIVYLARAD